MKVTLDIVQCTSVQKKIFAIEKCYFLRLRWTVGRDCSRGGGVHEGEQQQLLLQQPKPPRSPVL